MNYKKITALLAAFAAALSLYSCGNKGDIANFEDDEQPEITLALTTEADIQSSEAPVETDAVQKEEKPVGDNVIFSEIGSSFVFSIGNGGWNTTLNMEKDGSFEGIYQDSGYETDENGFAVPVIDYCGFRGKFGKAKKVDDYTYTVSLIELNTTDELVPPGDYIKKYTSQPYGLEDCTYFNIYKKGAEISSLPSECQRWITLSGLWTNDAAPQTLPFDVLFNTSAEFAFCGSEESAVLTEPEKTESDDPMTVLSGPYVFETGIGDWCTKMKLGSDGSFTGDYYDMDVEEDEDGTSKTSTEYRSFTGKISELKKKDDLTYTFTVEELTLSDELPDDQDDEYGYYLADYAFGLEEELEYTVYMSGTKTTDLPEGCLDRISLASSWDEESIPETISFTVIYNEEYESTFAFIKSET